MSSSPNLQGVKVQRRKIKPSGNGDSSRNARINDMKKRKRNFFLRISYPTVITSVVLPFLAFAYLIHQKLSLIPEKAATLYFCVMYHIFTILAFTAGYHKCYSHSSFRPKYSFLQVYFAIFGASIGIGPIRWWAGLHRAHHQFTDHPDKDPYSIKRGFLWAHWGWLLKRSKSDAFFREFVENEFSLNEIESDDYGHSGQRSRAHYENFTRQYIIWQEERYWLFFLFSTILLPVVITVYFCEDTWINGLIYPGILRMFACQQSLMSVESFGHSRRLPVTFPSQPFNDKNSSVNCMNPFFAMITFGQNSQNYHHEFPHDYRDSSALWAYDPTKWFIALLNILGLVEDVSKTPTNLVIQLQIQQQQAVLNRRRSQLNWGTPISKLPMITTKEFKKLCGSADNKHRIYIVIQNIIHDITPFMDQHPGGVALLKASHGKDATKAFYGGVYGHSTAAVNLLATMRIGVLASGNDEEVWRRVAREEGEVNDNDSRREQSGSHSTAEAA
ncbi:hypothetical protein FDK38_000638 [Candidozyma auris]|nr:hypothetical protein FDK38_000638 [[Candida] auris]